MTKHNETYTVTLTEKTDVPAIVQLIEMEQDLGDLAFVGCENVTIAQNEIPAAGGPLSLSVTCNAAFAAEVENTVGVASVCKQTVRPRGLAL